MAIDPRKKKRSGPSSSRIVKLVAGILVVGVAVYLLTGRGDRKPIPSPAGASSAPAVPPPPPKPGDTVLTVSGYVIPRERIEISPKFLGTVRTISIKKGDVVKKGDVLVELENDEHAARLMESEGRVRMAEAALAFAQREFQRQQDLSKSNVESERALDEARRNRDAAIAELDTSKGQYALARTYFEWCTIRAPIDGTILEKLVNPNELVVPQSFGSGRGPSTAFLAMANLDDLQVEIDLNEADTPKVHMRQSCRVSPEAYPDRQYEGFVAEIAPEANRSKGTLQVKVQIRNPDRYLTPELTAKVDFLAE
jgi:HlyD family secretion protein